MLRDATCRDILLTVRDVAMMFSDRENVLFDFSSLLRVGFGGVRRFDSNDRTDVALANRISSDGFSNDDGDLAVWACVGSGVLPDYVVQVGVQDFSSKIYHLRLSYDCALASMLVSMAHELQHVRQYDVARDLIVRPSDMHLEVVRSLVMSCDNKAFYGLNYSHMVHEIDAERFGVLAAYALLEHRFGESRAKDAMSSVLRRSDRLHIAPVHYGEAFSQFDVEHFELFMNEAFQDAVVALRDVTPLFDVNGNDFAVGYFSLNDDDKSDFLQLGLGWEQDAYLAAMSVRFCEKSRLFFSEDMLALSDDLTLPCGGVLHRPIAVDESSRRLPVIGFDMPSDEDEFAF